ncbi:MAG: energy-coupling factor ABC transporter permease [Clostridia bacterium]|nr:energy-coupling factor ABC transporter permease [Clostridia bacterium]
MHIPDGVLAGHVSSIGYGLSFIMAMLTIGKKKLAREMAKISLVTAVMFVASIITIPLGYTSVHFSFLGLAGVFLGPRAFISVGIAVFLQLILFKHGGVSTLGVNIFNLGMGALVGWLIFSLHSYAINEGVTRDKIKYRKVIGVFAGFAASMAAITKVSLGSAVLYYSGYPLEVAATLFLAHLPVFILEGMATGLLAGALVATGMNVSSVCYCKFGNKLD